MSQTEMQAQGSGAGQEERKAVEQIPITEPGDNARKIPRAIFIEDVEAWVEKYGDDPLFSQMNTLHQKYKVMEGQTFRQRQNLRVKLPDIKKTLEMVALLK